MILTILHRGSISESNSTVVCQMCVYEYIVANICFNCSSLLDNVSEETSVVAQSFS